MGEKTGAAREDRHALMCELLGTKCRCGADKQARQTFCRNCYYRLPLGLRTALYLRLGAGYEQAYVRALNWLEGGSAS